MVDETVLNEAEGSFDDPIDLENADFGDAPEQEAAEAAPEPKTEGEAETADEVEPLEGASGEGEETADEEVDEEPAAPKKREPMLPKHRYDSVRRRLREVEAQLEAERQAKVEAGEPEEPAAPVRDFDAEIGDLNEKFTQALLDADSKEASSLNQQMMALQQEKIQAIIDAGRSDVISESRDSVLTDTLVDELVASNAKLNPDSDSFDQPLVTRLNSMRKYYENSEGLSESQALVKSVETLMPDAFGSTETVDPEKGKKLADKIAKAKGQPPNANRVGDDGPAFGQGQELDPYKLTLDDLDKVTDAQWDQMLGNNL